MQKYRAVRTIAKSKCLGWFAAETESQLREGDVLFHCLLNVEGDTDMVGKSFVFADLDWRPKDLTVYAFRRALDDLPVPVGVRGRQTVEVINDVTQALTEEDLCTLVGQDAEFGHLLTIRSVSYPQIKVNAVELQVLPLDEFVVSAEENTAHLSDEHDTVKGMSVFGRRGV
jgi:hypothetical protein